MLLHGCCNYTSFWWFQSDNTFYGGQQLDSFFFLFFFVQKCFKFSHNEDAFAVPSKTNGLCISNSPFFWYYLFSVAQEESTMETKRSFACTKPSWTRSLCDLDDYTTQATLASAKPWSAVLHIERTGGISHIRLGKTPSYLFKCNKLYVYQAADIPTHGTLLIPLYLFFLQ